MKTTRKPSGMSELTQALHLYANNASVYRDLLGNLAAECPQCFVRMKKTKPSYYVCRRCGKLWKLEM